MPSPAGGPPVGSVSATAEPGRQTRWDLGRGDALGDARTVIARLGSGRKSDVYLAWDRVRHCTVAAKLLLPTWRLHRRLEREAELLERLRHPLFVRGLDAELDGPRPHLVLEHIEGPSLRDLIRRSPVAPEVVAAIGHQMATVLHYLVSEGMVHLDVKPQNILLASEGALPVAKLIDIGAVKAVGRPSKGAGGAVPELGRPEAEATPAAAVWILGSTMWRALGGGEVRGDRPRHPITDARASKAFTDVIAECLREAPSERPSAEEVAVALEPIVEAGAGGRAGGVRRWFRRER